MRGLEPLLDEAVSLLAELRAESAGLSRRPGLAEFLNWLMVLNEYRSIEGHLTTRTVRGTIGVLAKTAADVQRANAVVESWLARRGG